MKKICCWFSLKKNLIPKIWCRITIYEIFIIIIIRLTAFWRERLVQQVETTVSERFIRVKLDGERGGVHPFFAAVGHRITQSVNKDKKREDKPSESFIICLWCPQICI